MRDDLCIHVYMMMICVLLSYKECLLFPFFQENIQSWGNITLFLETGESWQQEGHLI